MIKRFMGWLGGSLMDVVYPYKTSLFDFELRYSLRSLHKFMPHRRVIVAGDKPSFISRLVHFVPVSRDANRYRSSTTNIAAAVKQAVETEKFVVMNDDFFLLRPWTFRHENRGTIEEYLASGQPQGLYRLHVEWTRDILKAHGVSDPLWFGLHRPTVYERDKLMELITEFKGQRYLLRTLYHNLFPQPSERREDVKIKGWAGEPPSDLDLLSTADLVAHNRSFQAWLKGKFPSPSPYEYHYAPKNSEAILAGGCG